MQRTGEMFGVRVRVWIGALLGVTVFCVALQLARKTGSTAPNAESKKNLNEALSVSAHISPAPPVATVPQNGFDPTYAKLLQELSDPDVNVRVRAVETLDKLDLPNSECVSLLTGCLSDSDARIRAHAALRLGSFRLAAMDAVPTLKQLAQTESDDLVRARVKDALYNIRMYDYSPFMREQ